MPGNVYDGLAHGILLRVGVRRAATATFAASHSSTQNRKYPSVRPPSLHFTPLHRSALFDVIPASVANGSVPLIGSGALPLAVVEGFVNVPARRRLLTRDEVPKHAAGEERTARLPRRLSAQVTPSLAAALAMDGFWPSLTNLLPPGVGANFAKARSAGPKQGPFLRARPDLARLLAPAHGLCHGAQHQHERGGGSAQCAELRLHPLFTAGAAAAGSGRNLFFPRQ